jgi:general stress protein YciG
MTMKKNLAAQKLGKLGGLARKKKATKEKLSEIGRKGAAARWKKAGKHERI